MARRSSGVFGLLRAFRSAPGVPPVQVDLPTNTDYRRIWLVWSSDILLDLIGLLDETTQPELFRLLWRARTHQEYLLMGKRVSAFDWIRIYQDTHRLAWGPLRPLGRQTPAHFAAEAILAVSDLFRTEADRAFLIAFAAARARAAAENSDARIAAWKAAWQEMANRLERLLQDGEKHD